MENLPHDHSLELRRRAYDPSLQCDEEMRQGNPAAALATGFDFEDGEVLESDVPPPLVRQTNENSDN